jgi:hypothetical protein
MTAIGNIGASIGTCGGRPAIRVFTATMGTATGHLVGPMGAKSVEFAFHVFNPGSSSPVGSPSLGRVACAPTSRRLPCPKTLANHLGPLLCFLGDKLSKLGRRARKHRPTRSAERVSKTNGTTRWVLAHKALTNPVVMRGGASIMTR